MTITWVNKPKQRVYKIPSGWPNAGKSIPADAWAAIEIKYLGPFRKVNIDESTTSKRLAWLTSIKMLFVKNLTDRMWRVTAYIAYKGDKLTEDYYSNANAGFLQDIKRVTGFTPEGHDGQYWDGFNANVDCNDATDTQVLNAILCNRHEITYYSSGQIITPVKLKT